MVARTNCDRCEGFRVTAEKREGAKYFTACTECSPGLPNQKVWEIRNENWREIPVIVFS